MKKAIAIHGPYPKQCALFKYIVDNYGMVNTNKEDIKYLISLAKLMNEYGKRYRAEFAKRVCEKLGIKPEQTVDASHIAIDDNNVFRCIAQGAHKGEISIYVDKVLRKVYLFKGLGNPNWNESVPGSTYITYQNMPYKLDQFAQSLSPSAELYMVADLITDRQEQKR